MRSVLSSIVISSLKDRYNSKIADKCLQSSVLTSEILKCIGINCEVVFTWLLIPEFEKQATSPLGFIWGGFTGDNHHIIAKTEFNEVVDLTISRLNEYPLASKEFISGHPIWWKNKENMPTQIEYCTFEEVKFSLADKIREEVKEIFPIVTRKIRHYTKSNKLKAIMSKTTLGNTGDLEKLLAQKDEWATRLFAINQAGYPPPVHLLEQPLTSTNKAFMAT